MANQPCGQHVARSTTASGAVDDHRRVGTIRVEEEREDREFQRFLITQLVVFNLDRAHVGNPERSPVLIEEIDLIVRKLPRRQKAAHTKNAIVLHKADPFLDLHAVNGLRAVARALSTVDYRLTCPRGAESESSHIAIRNRAV
jgi:hypothetical protein